ncbi:MAG: hypothetical protein KME22_06665 [Hassallia sp. WJT32-NPBG1]|jgi:hypothetical protein|nr:hypothetical protein [Hassallia sp. WJT32-NPBG1]
MNQIENSQSERDRLRSECHRLIDEIARKPYYVRLLGAAKHSLTSINGYKKRKPISTKKISEPTIKK